MDALDASDVDTFSSQTLPDFVAYLASKPSTRRVSPSDKSDILAWLQDPLRKPSSQRDQSRRNYVRKTFEWDQDRQVLLVQASSASEARKSVVTQDEILDTVRGVHEQNGHKGWDATWRDVSSQYHGILREDVIFLLKQCQVCLHNPRKRAKNPENALQGPHREHDAAPDDAAGQS